MWMARTGATGDPGAVSFQPEVTLLTDAFAQPMTGYLGEAGVWPSAFDGTQKAAMDTNQSTYWGI